MQIIDLTHTIQQQMSVFPGTELPQLELVSSFEKDGYRENKLCLYSHTGTHLDAPFHMLAQGKTLDALELSQFMGLATLIDLTETSSPEIGIEDLREYESYLNSSDFLILHTGWQQYWGTPRYFDIYPTLSLAAAQWLGQFKLKGIGIDAISIDHVESGTFPLHHLFLEAGLVIFENLTNLDRITTKQFTFSGLPLKIKDGDGSPIRAIAILAEE